MIELVLLIAIVAAVVLALRKRGGADAPVILQRPGLYHITLAPQLGSVRGFIESLGQRLAEDCRPAGDVPTRYFRVTRAGDDEFFLMAVAFRKGICFIQAIVPRPLVTDAAGHLAALREFSETVLLHYPPVPPVDAGGAGKMSAAIGERARQAGLAADELAA